MSFLISVRSLQMPKAKKSSLPMIVGYYMAKHDSKPYPIFRAEMDDYVTKMSATPEEARKNWERRNKK